MTAPPGGRRNSLLPALAVLALASSLSSCNGSTKPRAVKASPTATRATATPSATSATPATAGAGPVSPALPGRVAFRRYLDTTKTTGALFTSRTDGSHEHQVLTAPTGTEDGAPDWSPNGSRLLFTRVSDSRSDHEAHALWTVPSAGGKATALAAGRRSHGNIIPGFDEAGSYSPNGRQVAYIHAEGRVRAASAADICVGMHGGCYRSLQTAVDAAPPRSVIRIEHGTFRGGVTINKDLRLVGAGARSTIIRGGDGSVLTIGSFGATIEPTVSIRGVTITGGVVRSSPESLPFVGKGGVWALGGGIEIPPGANSALGATVHITNSVVTANRVAPSRTVDSGLPCPRGQCPFALAAGGGVDSWGTLTLDNTTVSHNRVGSASGLSSLASDSQSGAIQNWRGPLTIRTSTITGNTASATAPNGRFADSGGIFMEGGRLSMIDSSVTNNRASLAAALPRSVDLLAVAGGVHISDKASGTVNDTTISGNSVSMTNTVGDATASSGGLHSDVDTLTMRDDVISNNTVTVATLTGSAGNAAGDSGAGELGGTISDTRLTGNNVAVSSVAGNADASAGATIVAGSMVDSVVSRNHARASSPRGAATVVAGGLVGAVKLTLRNTTVSANSGQARGRTGSARGGGIFDAPVPNGAPPGPLTLINTAVTRNTLSATHGITLQGGGVFTTEPVTLTNSVIAYNRPDQCRGCGPGTVRQTAPRLSR